ncbi:hypothetical protein BDZ91DRAFT_744106 [Kalaharituber pfeilii]|nr:hypothetical protein BDZ91DRAFT_744106 [Kalaharituber pfeilii]
MPRPNKKRKATLLAVAARGAKRRAAIEPDISELIVLVEEGISRLFVYSESKEFVDESTSECDDIEEEEYDEQEIQDLNSRLEYDSRCL